MENRYLIWYDALLRSCYYYHYYPAYFSRFQVLTRVILIILLEEQGLTRLIPYFLLCLQLILLKYQDPPSCLSLIQLKSVLLYGVVKAHSCIILR